MKTPTVEKMFGEAENSWLKNGTPEKIEFNLSEAEELNNTPTFNSHLSEANDAEDKENKVAKDGLCGLNPTQIGLVEKSTGSALGGNKKAAQKRHRSEEEKLSHDEKRTESTSPESSKQSLSKGGRKSSKHDEATLIPDSPFHIRKIKDKDSKIS